ncbi:MAG: hypothetical protein ACXIUM_02280 [Wenzhouxiangella sp.]
MTGTHDLLKRRAAALSRIERERLACAEHFQAFSAGTRAWAGSAQSLLQAFLAGVLADQALAALRYPLLAHGVLRPLSGALRLLAKYRNLL